MTEEAEYRRLSEMNMKRAREVIEATDVVNIWRGIGAEINLVGSLSMGLMCRHRDIDFHIYTSPLDKEESWLAISRLAQKEGVRRVEYRDLTDTEEQCIEWHAWYEYSAKDVWQIDMIHIRKASKYDGYFEKVAECIKNMMTEEQKKIILRLKYETPDEIKIPGIQYYKAVIKHHIHNYADFEKWCIYNPLSGIEVWPLETD